ncbi:MAG: histidinol-phosphate transaminase, partial [Pseudomonadota bacterium]|nr:histidinol-phosphate transaminase [Pseudomonadota bacterium]
MMDKVNQRIAALQPYKPGKPIEELARELGINDIVKLASNENPLGPAQQVLDAISEASTQLPRYPDGSGYELKQALATQLE